jgi:Tfp pilus assembly protein PilN
MNESHSSYRAEGRCRSLYRRIAARCLVVGALAIGSACIAVQSNRRAAMEMDRRAEYADRDWNNAAAQVQAVVDLRHTQDSLVGRAEQAETLLVKYPRSLVLAEVTNALLGGCWLTDFDMDSASSAGDALHVQLTGLAPGDADVGRYVDRLRDSKLLHEVKLSESHSANQQGKAFRRFRIDLRVGDLVAPEVRVVPPTMTASIGH